MAALDLGQDLNEIVQEWADEYAREKVSFEDVVPLLMEGLRKLPDVEEIAEISRSIFRPHPNASSTGEAFGCRHALLEKGCTPAMLHLRVSNREFNYGTSRYWRPLSLIVFYPAHLARVLR